MFKLSNYRRVLFRYTVKKRKEIKQYCLYYSRYAINRMTFPALSIAVSDSGPIFLTFSNFGYRKPNRIIAQAVESGWFSKVNLQNESSIAGFVDANRDFIKMNKYVGYGLWSWKPTVILSELDKILDGDLLVYADSGTYINAPNGTRRFDFYINSMFEENLDVIFFASTSGSVNPYSAIIDFNIGVMKRNSYDTEFFLPTSIYAGLMVIKKNSRSVDLIESWKRLCADHKLLAEIQDSDNGLLQFCLPSDLKYKIISGAETNVFDSKGLQIKHFLSDSDYKKYEWKELETSPFQIRRMR